jgi:hypothetical protein
LAKASQSSPDYILEKYPGIAGVSPAVDTKGPRKNKFVFYGAGVLAAGEA